MLKIMNEVHTARAHIKHKIKITVSKKVNTKRLIWTRMSGKKRRPSLKRFTYENQMNPTFETLTNERAQHANDSRCVCVLQKLYE